jgi:hypothetical protein
MKVKCWNVDSAFDWTADVVRVLERLTPADSAASLGFSEHRVVVGKRFDTLQTVLLVSDASMRIQLQKNEWGEGENGRGRVKDRDDDWSFRSRRGHNGEAPTYRSPRFSGAGGVIEALGIYLPDLHAYAEQLALSRMSLAAWLASHSDVPRGPAVLLCPELLFELPNVCARALDQGEPRPRTDATDLFFRMTLLHEVGHHVLPETSDRFLSEGLANAFCFAHLTPEERSWLFAKAWLLQPSPYLAVFAARSLDECTGGPSSIWRAMIAGGLGVAPPKLADARGPWLVSPQMADAIQGIAQAMGIRVLLPRPCALGPFEELAVRGNSALQLVSYLNHPAPTVQASAFDGLSYQGAIDRLPPLVATAMAEWCDGSIGAAVKLIALRAWNAREVVDRAAGAEPRYQAAASSVHEELACSVPERAASVLGGPATEALCKEMLGDRRAKVRLEAGKALAARAIERGDEALLEVALGKDASAVAVQASQLCVDETPRKILVMLLRALPASSSQAAAGRARILQLVRTLWLASSAREQKEQLAREFCALDLEIDVTEPWSSIFLSELARGSIQCSPATRGNAAVRWVQSSSDLSDFSEVVGKLSSDELLRVIMAANERFSVATVYIAVLGLLGSLPTRSKKPDLKPVYRALFQRAHSENVGWIVEKIAWLVLRELELDGARDLLTSPTIAEPLIEAYLGSDEPELLKVLGMKELAPYLGLIVTLIKKQTGAVIRAERELLKTVSAGGKFLVFREADPEAVLELRVWAFDHLRPEPDASEVTGIFLEASDVAHACWRRGGASRERMPDRVLATLGHPHEDEARAALEARFRRRIERRAPHASMLAADKWGALAAIMGDRKRGEIVCLDCGLTYEEYLAEKCPECSRRNIDNVSDQSPVACSQCCDCWSENRRARGCPKCKSSVIG